MAAWRDGFISQAMRLVRNEDAVVAALLEAVQVGVGQVGLGMG
jgi:hypothetical protein